MVDTAQLDPAQLDPAQLDPARAEPVRAEPVRPDAATDAATPEPATAEPANAAPPAAGDPVVAEGARPHGASTPGATETSDRQAAVWARVQMARNLRRPRTIELIRLLGEDFVELHGDRLFGDDPAIVGGLARVGGRRVVVVGHQKGAETDENIRRNFGMPHPEGYRKAMRLMDLAERLGMPVVTFIDVPGAHPGPESEERGIAEAIAQSIGLMSRLRAPIVAVISGEGGSGGALAIAVGDVVIALENAVYSVISPEGCASILWRTADQAPAAALAMRMTAADQAALGVVDIVVPEPPGGAQANHVETARRLKEVIVEQLDTLAAQPIDGLLEARYARYRAMGAFATTTLPTPAPPVERQRLTDRLRTLIGGALPQLPTATPGRSRDDSSDDAEA